MTPSRVVAAVLEAAEHWSFDAISIGYPGLVAADGPRSEPLNLGPGWVGFNFAAAFERPVKIVNDAAMQALGSYSGGRMLFLGLGTGLGSALVTDNVVIPLELGELPYRRGGLGEAIGRAGLKRDGRKAWRRAVRGMLDSFFRAFSVDCIVLGGGNAKLMKNLPSGVRLGNNLIAFRGCFRLWNVEDVKTLLPEGQESHEKRLPIEWRIV